MVVEWAEEILGGLVGQLSESPPALSAFLGAFPNGFRRPSEVSYTGGDFEFSWVFDRCGSGRGDYGVCTVFAVYLSPESAIAQAEEIVRIAESLHCD
jgi:hypothetical protein